MRITYKNTFADVMRFQIAHQFFSIAYQAIIFGVCVFVYFAEADAQPARDALYFAVAWYVLAWVVQVLWTAFFLFTRRGPTDQAEHTIEIQSYALLEETIFHRSLHFWRSPMKLVQRAGLCAVYVTPNSALVIPRRAFESKQHREEFLSLLRQRLAQSCAAH